MQEHQWAVDRDNVLESINVGLMECYTQSDSSTLSLLCLHLAILLNSHVLIALERIDMIGWVFDTVIVRVSLKHRRHPLALPPCFPSDLRESLDQGELVHNLSALGCCLVLGPTERIIGKSSVLQARSGGREGHFWSCSGFALGLRVTLQTGRR
jgi:hypothetical protein